MIHYPLLVLVLHNHCFLKTNMTNYCNPILTWGRGLGQDQEWINRGLKRSSDQHKVKQVSFKFVTARCGDLGKPFTWKKKKNGDVFWKLQASRSCNRLLFRTYIKRMWTWSVLNSAHTHEVKLHSKLPFRLHHGRIGDILTTGTRVQTRLTWLTSSSLGHVLTEDLIKECRSEC